MGVMTAQERREWVIFENEGKKLFGVIHLPPLENPPIVLTMHGYASHKVGSGRSYVKLAQALCREGIACLRFDFRGCGDSEGELSEMTLESFISDALAATHFIEKKGFSRLGFFGSSFGGTISILSAARLFSLKALAVWAPVASGELWFQDFLASNQVSSQDPAQIFSTFRGVKLDPVFRDQFGKMVAYKTLEELADVPFLHFQGELDETISLKHQKAFEAHRKGAIGPSRFITYPDTKHTLGYAKVFPEVINECVNWFKTYL